jgi:hypothetical protein
MPHPLRFGEPSVVFSTRVPESLHAEFKAYVDRVIVIRKAGYDVRIEAQYNMPRDNVGAVCQQPT